MRWSYHIRIKYWIIEISIIYNIESPPWKSQYGKSISLHNRNIHIDLWHFNLHNYDCNCCVCNCCPMLLRKKKTWYTYTNYVNIENQKCYCKEWICTCMKVSRFHISSSYMELHLRKVHTKRAKLDNCRTGNRVELRWRHCHDSYCSKTCSWAYIVTNAQRQQ